MILHSSWSRIGWVCEKGYYGANFQGGFCRQQPRTKEWLTRLHGLDQCTQFLIARLGFLYLLIAFRRHKNKGRRDLTHQKPASSKFHIHNLRITSFATVLQKKPRANYFWAFKFGHLWAVQMRQMCSELVFHEVVRPVLSSTWCVTYPAREVCHIFHHTQFWRKLLFIKIEYLLYSSMLSKETNFWKLAMV